MGKKNTRPLQLMIIQFIGSMQFMNSNLDTLVKNLSEMDFKYLSQDFTSEQLILVKQRNISI